VTTLVLLLIALALSIAIPTNTITNHTGSMPQGKYLLFGPTVKVGDFAIACLSAEAAHTFKEIGSTLESGYCPGGVESILKVVVAIPGDHYAVTDAGIVVNGRLLDHSRPIVLAGRTRLPRPAPGIVPPGEAMFWSPVSTALDSRYVGPLVVRNAAIALDGISAVDAQRLLPEFH
jgi:type IV secretory pathway protease TraF